MASTSATTLDNLIDSKDVVPLPPRDDHLFYPSLNDDETTGRDTPPVEPQARQMLTDRLFIGNLHPSVDEYTLLQVFSKFGKVTKLDYMFHKSGLLKGKPRGYAFVEYADKYNQEAEKALNSAHDKLLRGRKLVVTFAQQAPLDQHPATAKTRKTMMDVGRPTALSMIKTGVHGRRHEGKTQDKIAMMEAKLRQMERTNPKPKPPSPVPMDMSSDPSASNSSSFVSTSAPTTKSHPSLPDKPASPASSSATPLLPYHPSLPAKPPPTIAGLQTPAPQRSNRQSTGVPAGGAFGAVKKTLPKDAQSLAAPLIKSLSASKAPTTTKPTKVHKLTGVKIKAKEKVKVDSPQPLS